MLRTDSDWFTLGYGTLKIIYFCTMGLDTNHIAMGNYKTDLIMTMHGSIYTILHCAHHRAASFWSFLNIFRSQSTMHIRLA